MEHHKGGIGSFLSGAIVATALGGYFLFVSKNGKENREKVEEWVESARSEVLDQVRKMKKLTREKYDEIIDNVSDKYAEMKEVGKEKADKLRTELKHRWSEVEREARANDFEVTDEE